MDVKAYNPKHPKGRQYNEKEIILHRNNWYEKVKITNQNINSNVEYRKLDIEVYNKIKQMLYNTSVINFLRTNNFAYPFKRIYINTLFEFIKECEFNPEFEFIDADLEAMKGQLHSSISVFISVLGDNSWSIGVNGELSSIPAEWKYEQIDKFSKIVNEIHEMTIKITDDYDNLVRLSRKRLIIYINGNFRAKQLVTLCLQHPPT